jgi:hypothetical protein
VAAYFAFQDVDPNVDKSVAIFAFLDTPTGTKGIRLAEPNIKRVRLDALIEERHKRQNSTYTYCSTESKEGEYYSGHEKVFMGNRKTKHQQDALWKYIIPYREKEKVIEKLKSKNINASSILPMAENHQDAQFFQNLFRELGG